MFASGDRIIGKMGSVTVKRISHFNAAHRLNVSQWSKEKNESFFGLCNNEFYHGHNYKIEVCVSGEVDPVSGYLIDMKDLKKIIEEEVVGVWDHKNLNLQVEDFKTLNPTAENIAMVAYDKLRLRLDKDLSLKVVLHETERNIVEYEGI